MTLAEKVLAMDAITHVPAPRNEPVLDYAPGTPERAALEARLAELAGEPLELTITIGGEQRMAGGEPIDVVQPHKHAAVLGTSAHATHADARGRRRRRAKEAAPGVAGAVLRRPGRDLPAGRRPARRPVAGDAQRGHHARPVARPPTRPRSTRACELIDFWRFNVHFARQLLAEQPISLAGRLEPARPPPARGLRLRDHAVQLHRDRRQPADRAGADGQHRGLEAVADPAVRRALH